jgi:hypothetical protein
VLKSLPSLCLKGKRVTATTKKQGIPFIVFADDFLVFGTSQKEMNQLYVALQQELVSI